jgi:hypothetical protein
MLFHCKGYLRCQKDMINGHQIVEIMNYLNNSDGKDSMRPSDN